MAAEHEVAIPAVSASGTSAIVAELSEIPVDVETESQVVAAHFIPQTTQATQGGTNHVVMQVRDVSQSNRVLASADFGTVGLTAETSVDLTLGANTAVKGGDVLDVYALQAGTGGAIPAGRLVLEVE